MHRSLTKNENIWLIIFVLCKSRTFIMLHFLVVINAWLVYKHDKYRKKIPEIADFIHYLSRKSPISFNALYFQIYNSFILYRIEMIIILWQIICYTVYWYDYCIRGFINSLFFIVLLFNILAINIAFCMAIILVLHILWLKICDSYNFLLVSP